MAATLPVSAAKLEEAKKIAETCIKNNGEDGGRAQEPSAQSPQAQSSGQPANAGRQPSYSGKGLKVWGNRHRHRAQTLLSVYRLSYNFDAFRQRSEGQVGFLFGQLNLLSQKVAEAHTAASHALMIASQTMQNTQMCKRKRGAEPVEEESFFS